MRLIDIEQPTAHKIVIFGAPGLGKTTLAAQAHQHTKLSPTLVIDAEEGSASIVKIAKELRPDITKPRNMIEILAIIDELCNAKEPNYKTIVVDTLGSVIEKFFMGMYADEVPSNQEYRALNAKVARMLDRLMYKGYSVILLAHEKTLVENNIPVKLMDFSSGLGVAIAKRVDVVGRLTSVDSKGVIKRVLLTNPVVNSIVKNRLNKLADFYVDPYMPKLYDDLTAIKVSE